MTPPTPMTPEERLCPREPTPDMLCAASNAHDDYMTRPKGSGLVTPKGPDFWSQLIWTAMWDSVPATARISTLEAALREHHEWQLRFDLDDPEHGFNYAVEYQDSGMCERTLAALEGAKP